MCPWTRRRGDAIGRERGADVHRREEGQSTRALAERRRFSFACRKRRHVDAMRFVSSAAWASDCGEAKVRHLLRRGDKLEGVDARLIRKHSQPARKGQRSTGRCQEKERMPIGQRTVGRRCGSPARRATPTWRHSVCEGQHIDAVRLLLEKGADRGDRDDGQTMRRRYSWPCQGEWPRRCCAARGMLLDKGAEAIATGQRRAVTTPLFIACQNGHVDAAVCCWRKAMRSTGRKTVRRVHACHHGPRRRGAPVVR